jgi:hypothetical protein
MTLFCASSFFEKKKEALTIFQKVAAEEISSSRDQPTVEAMKSRCADRF